MIVRISVEYLVKLSLLSILMPSYLKDSTTCTISPFISISLWWLFLAFVGDEHKKCFGPIDVEFVVFVQFDEELDERAFFWRLLLESRGYHLTRTLLCRRRTFCSWVRWWMPDRWWIAERRVDQIRSLVVLLGRLAQKVKICC